MGVSYSQYEFIGDVIEHIKDNRVVIVDENNRVITETEMIDTLNAIYLKRNKKYLDSLSCKPHLLLPHIPEKWNKYIYANNN